MADKTKVIKWIGAAGAFSAAAVFAPVLLPFAGAAVPLLKGVLETQLGENLTSQLSSSALDAVKGVAGNLASNVFWERPDWDSDENEDMARALVAAYREALVDALHGLSLPEQKIAADILNWLPSDPVTVKESVLINLFFIAEVPGNISANLLSPEDTILTIAEETAEARDTIAEDVHRTLRRWYNTILYPDSIIPPDDPLPEGKMSALVAERLGEKLNRILKRDEYKKSWTAFQRAHFQEILKVIREVKGSTGLTLADRAALDGFSQSVGGLLTSDEAMTLLGDHSREMLERIYRSESEIKAFIADSAGLVLRKMEEIHVDVKTVLEYVRNLDAKLFPEQEEDESEAEGGRFHKKNDDEINPFKGLEVYNEEDENFFYGRKSWLDGAVTQFIQGWDAKYHIPFFGIIGGSGVGKSSLLRAGMIARLKNLTEKRGYETAVLMSNSIIPPRTESVDSADKEPRSGPLGRMLSGVLIGIRENYDRRARKKVLEATEAAAIEKIMNAYDQIPEAMRPEFAVKELISSLDAIAAAKKNEHTGPLNLVVGMDQFEEVLDYWQNLEDKTPLRLLYRFLDLACESERIGFIYTCQTNREVLLSADDLLAPLVKGGTTKDVKALDEDEIREVARTAFEKAKICISVELVEALFDRLENFAEANAQADLPSEEIRATLLPLFSLTLLRIYEFCQVRKKQFKAEQENKSGLLSADGFGQNPESEEDREDMRRAYAGYFDRTFLHADVLFLTLEEKIVPMLDVGQAISELAERALMKVRAAAAVESEDDLNELLRRLIRVHRADENRYELKRTVMPISGPNRVFLEEFLAHRLLVPSGANQFKLVHEAVITYWPLAQGFVQKEKRIMLASNKLLPLAELWKNGTITTAIIGSLVQADSTIVDAAGSVLRGWSAVFLPGDGTPVESSDLLLQDFSLMVLEAAMTPGGVHEDGESSISHFLLAVSYGRLDLVKKYLEIEPDAAKTHISGAKKRGPVFLAIAQYGGGNLEMIELLVNAGADLDAEDNLGWRPIHRAAFQGDLEVVEYLAEKGIDVDVKGLAGRRPLFTAAMRDREDVVRYLADRSGIEINARDDEGWTALNMACRELEGKSAKFLLGLDGIDTSLATNDNWAPLHVASRYGRADLVEMLLKDPGSDPNRVTDVGFTPLMLATYNTRRGVGRTSGHPVQVLLKDDRIDRNAETKLQKTAVQLAIETKNYDILRMVLDDPLELVDPDLSFGEAKSPLLKACEDRDQAALDLLLAGGADVNYISGGTTPFLYSIQNRGIEVVELLLASADLTRTDDNDNGPLYLATARGDLEIASLLIGEKVRRNEENVAELFPSNKNPLHLAAAAGLIPFIREFLKYADPAAIDPEGFAPLHRAAEKGFAEAVLVFLNVDKKFAALQDGLGRGISHISASIGDIDMAEIFGESFDADAPDAEGMRPLHYAARFGHASFVDFLLRRNVDIDARDDFGWTPLHMSAQNGHTDAVKSLIRGKAMETIVGKRPAHLPVHAAVETGQTELVEILLPGLRPPERHELLDELTLLAINNAQFQTASRLLLLRGE